MALRARPGFSLIELFTVLAIVAILTALAVPRLHDFKHRYYQATLLSDLRNLAVDRGGVLQRGGPVHD